MTQRFESRTGRFWLGGIVAALLLGCLAEAEEHKPEQAASDKAHARLAEEIVRSAGVSGGLCVHVNCADGRLTAELANHGKFVVHGLVLDKQSLANTRKTVQDKKLYGPVSIEYCALAKLPYAADIVNLFVVDDLNAALKHNLSLEEVLRVLCPNGVAYVGSQDGALKAAELKSILERAGLKDFKIFESSGVWARIQKPRPKELDDWTHWRHGPDGNMVSQDMAVGIPARLKWIAEPTWARMHVYFPKEGSCHKGGDVRAMVSEAGRLFCVHDVAPRGLEGPMRMVLTTRDAFSGVLLWERPIESLFPIEQPTKSKWCSYKFYWYRERSLAAVGGQVYTVLKQNGPLVALNGASGEVTRTYDQAGSPEEVVCYQSRLLLVEARKEDIGLGYGSLCCLDAVSGKLQWRNDKVAARYLAVDDNKVFCESAGEAVCLDITDGSEKWRKAKPEGAKVLCFSKEGRLLLKGERGNLYAVSAKDGNFLWSYQYKDLSGYSDTDIYFAGGLVWVQASGERWAMVGLDPATGMEKKRIDFPEEYPKTRGHSRCYPNKATERYFMLATAGIDFVDRQAGKVYDIRSYRGNCRFGLLPANGLLYLPPNVCQCGEYFRGFTALAPAENAGQKEVNDVSDGRFEKGPAFAKISEKAGTAGQDEWPTYRHDAGRSGSSPSDVSTELKLIWEKKIAGKITSPTVAEGMVFVAASDAHQVCAFDAQTGEARWSYTAGGRVDTPPTIYSGLALFGCRDGWVYGLRAKDGELAWRFHAAPQDRRIIAFDQLESAWPVFGSVLVQNDVVFFAAGRFSELDGGIYVYALDPGSGKILWSERTSDCLTGMLEGKIWKGYLPVSINDVLTAGDGAVCIGTTGFNVQTGKISPSQYRLWARPGMTDGNSWTGRMRWREGGVEAELLVFERENTYGILTPSNGVVAINPGKNEYKLFAKGAQKWSQQVPLRVNAMVLAGHTLFLAGVPDVVDEKDYWGAIDGKKGGELWAVSAMDGSKQASLKLESSPAFDGLAVAKGKFYLATTDSKLLCFGKK